MQVDGQLSLRYLPGELQDALLLLLVVLAIIMQISQLVLEQCFGLVGSQNASDVIISLPIELPRLALLFLLGFGAGELFSAQSLAI